ncbi:OmpA family protein [Compostibacter hankyongensis]|uniref:OmpA family protein n=1 Tax=Compostibacter hankyongensis TaxID=1007089 RepID=UPI003CD06E29
MVKALKADDNLKIAINGYTDNTGNQTHNLQLSKDRAATVMMIRDLGYYNTCSLAGICDEDNTPKEPPIWDYVAQPGNSSMQRLGLSPYEKKP